MAGPGEIAYFSQVGAVAEALGVPTPVNRTLQALVGLVEQSQRTPA